MKLISKLLCLVVMLAAFASCDRDYDAPPLNEPKYEMPQGAQTVTIAQLREMTKDAAQDSPATIEDSVFLKARISGDDRSGNIFKTLYIQDETGGISMLVDQSDVYVDYAAGQEVIIDLKGLCVSVYGDEQQIGHPSGYLYRTPYEDFKKHVHKNGWPDDKLLTIKDFENLGEISDDADANRWTLVRLTGVHFEDGGKATFAESNGYGTHNLVDAYGNSIVVRTSNYADFATKPLPVGTGNVIAVLGRFRGTWQLTIRSFEDVYGFDGKEPGGSVTPEPEPEDGTVIFNETMGTEAIKKDGQFWPYLKDFKGWVSGLTFTDVNSTLSARSVNGKNNIWFPAKKENDLKIEGFNTEGYKSLLLIYEIAANLYNDQGEQDAAAMTGSFNGQEFVTPSRILSGEAGDNNKFYTDTVSLPVSAAKAASELHFKTSATANTAGLRLANIKLVGKK